MKNQLSSDLKRSLKYQERQKQMQNKHDDTKGLQFTIHLK